MLIKEIISENTTDIDNIDQQILKISNKIKTDCAPYIQEIGGLHKALFGTPLYRGIRGKKANPLARTPLEVIYPLKDRKPSDTPPEVSQMVDEWLHKNTGYYFRSTSLFCSGRTMQASEYGRVYVVIPIGEFHYCWSPNVSDLYMDLYTHAMALESGKPAAESLATLNTKALIREVFVNNPAELDSFMHNGDYQFDNDLDGALHSRSEIMVACSRAYIIDCDWLRKASNRINSFGAAK